MIEIGEMAPPAASAPQLAEVTEVHTRILRLALGVDEARAYWANVDPTVPPGPRALQAFEQRWFGAKTLDRVKTLLPYLAVVAGLAFVLLTLVFRSVLVPLKATVGFLLSIAATFGAVVAVFQWGWLANVFGVEQTGPIMTLMPQSAWSPACGRSTCTAPHQPTPSSGASVTVPGWSPPPRSS